MSDNWWGIDAPIGGKLEAAPATIHVLPKANRKAVEAVRRTWRELRPEQIERDGRVYVDTETRTAYKRVNGDPALGGSNREDVSVFAVVDGYLLYLRHVGDPGHVISKHIGDMGSWRGSAADLMGAMAQQVAGPR